MIYANMEFSCITNPTVKKNFEEHYSKLFQDLSDTFNNRDVVVSIYAAAKIIEDVFDKNELDDLGEPKIEAVIEKFDLLNQNINDFKVKSIEQHFGSKDSNGTIYYKTYNNAYEKIITLNKLNGNNIGIIRYEDKKGYYIDIVKSDIDNSQSAETQKIVYELNPKFKRILNNFGFDVSRVDNLENNGVFSPENAEKNAEGFIDIIKLSKGIEGDYAFSEEFCHYVIAGLRNNTLVQRLFNNINIDVAKNILGNEYDSYVKRYKSKVSDSEELNNLIREEAIGKLLAESLINKNKSQKFVNNELFKRFENAIKSFFKNKDEQQIIDAIEEVKNSLNNIVDKIDTLDENFFENFSKKDVLSSKNLYKIKNKIKSEIEKVSEKIFNIALKEEQIAAIKAPGNTIEERREFLSNKKTNLELTKHYFNGDEHYKNCLNFLESSTQELKNLIANISDIKNEIKKNKRKYNETLKFGRCCYMLNSIKDFSSSYKDVIKSIQKLDVDDISREDLETLKNLSNELLVVLTNLETSYEEARIDVIQYWLETFYWKGNIKTKNEKGEDVILTLESLLREAPKDINGVDLLLSEMGHCSDIMLNLLSTITKKQMARRDQKLEDIKLRIDKIHKELNGETSFMYEFDSNNVPTGRLISYIDFDKFENEYNAFKKSLKEQDLDSEEIHEEIVNWYAENTESVLVDKANGRYEKLPKKSKYYKSGWDSRLSYSQKQYYNEMIQLKAEMETLIGPTNYHLYNAPQMSSDYIQKLSDQSNVKDKFKFAISELKHDFTRDSDDIDFGELDENGIKKVVPDMQGNPIKKIPIYFVHKLKDMNRLNTDFSKGISAYCAMAVNYSEMSQIVNQIETFKDLILDREVAQYSGNSLMMNIIKSGQNSLNEKITKEGRLTNIGKRLETYIDMNFYGMMKDDEGSFNVLGKEFDTAKTIDTAKSISGVVQLGLNPFSGFSNISMGEIQMLIEAMANTGMSLLGGEKDSFGIRDWAWAHKEYLIGMPKVLAESEAVIKTSKLGLLMRKFDVEQNFYDKLKSSGYYSNAAKRLLGNNSLSYIMQNAGEHYLHANLMLAMLHSKKVLLNGKKVSLYEAYDVKDGKIVEKGEIKELDGSKFTNDKFIDFKLKIQELSHQFNGAFGAEDLGTLQQKSWGRLIMQFRQWMPGHWGRRFASRYYNTATKQWMEGYWQTTGKFIKEIILSIVKTKRSIPEYWDSLTNYEKTNIMKTIMETMLLIAVYMLMKFAFDDDDDDDEVKSRLKQFMKYQCYRTYMEMVATYPPLLYQMGENSLKMLQSPMAAIKPIENIWKLVRIDNMLKEVEAGTYKGMSVWSRDALKGLPYYGQIRKVWDLSTEEYMFNLFKDK